MKIKYNPKYSDQMKNIVYLLDEPGSYLHSAAQEKLCEIISDNSRKDGIVIYCTHSHHLLNPTHIPPKKINLVKKEDNTNVTIQKITEIKTSLRKETALQPVFEALDICDWDFFHHGQKVIVVEGIYDKYALEVFCEIDLKKYVILPCDNANSAYSQIKKLIAYDKNYIVIWDDDAEGRKYYDKACKAYKPDFNKFLKLPNPNGIEKFRMEEMFFGKDLEEMARFFEMPVNSSYEKVMLALLSSSIEKRKSCIEVVSDNTKRNFEQLSKIINESFK